MSTESLPTSLFFRGELFLSGAEVEALNAQIAGSDFRFDPVVDVFAPPKPAPKKSKSGELHLRSKSQSFADEYVPYKSKSRRYSDESFTRYDSYGYSSSEFAERRTGRARKQTITFLEEFYEDHASLAYSDSYQRPEKARQRPSAPKAQKEAKQAKVMYRTVPISTKHLPKLPKNTWEYICHRILQVIKYMDTDKWFWYPVDPVVDGVPNYLQVIKRPMDFHTITERLHTNHYSSPYGWQTDMRQIFYNAFLFYKPDNLIWQSAQTLSRAFENKLRNARYVNPDEFFQSLSMDPEKLKEDIEAIYAPKTRRFYDTWAAPIPAPDEGRAKRRYGRPSRLDDDNYLEIDSVGSSQEYTDDDEYVNLNTKYASKKAVRPQRGLRAERARADLSSRQRKPAKFGKLYSEQETPEYGSIPQPPTLQKMLNDKPLTASQQKTLQANLMRLAPNQRRAALELIQDELGILAESHMNDPHFFFDTDLLSIERQKQFFSYVNQMAKANYEHLVKSDKGKAAKQADLRLLGAQEPFRGTAAMFDSSSTSSISDVASNLLSSDDFFSGSDSENDVVPDKPVRTDTLKDAGLPEYLPVDELDSGKPRLSEGVIGNHADFLGKLDTPSESDTVSNQGKKTAWTDWKGQAIHHRDVAKQTGVPPRNADEQIAESFDARI